VKPAKMMLIFVKEFGQNGLIVITKGYQYGRWNGPYTKLY